MNRGLIYVLASAAFAAYAKLAVADGGGPIIVPSASVPEPDTISLLAVGAGVIALVARRRRRK